MRCGRPHSGTVRRRRRVAEIDLSVDGDRAAELEEKQRQWRQTGIWIGKDLPPSLKSMRPATPEELRKLRGEDD